MTSLTLATLLHVSVAAVGAPSYSDAHRAATETGKPIVVMVSAEWCGPCQKMVKTVLPQVRSHGLLKRVSFAIVNVDREKTLARKLIGGGPVPQLVMFRRTNQGWLRRRLVGGQSTKAVEKFIQQGIAKDEAAKKAPARDKQKPASQEERAATKVAEKPEVQPVSRR